MAGADGRGYRIGVEEAGGHLVPIGFYPHSGLDDQSPPLTVGSALGIPSPPAVAFSENQRGEVVETDYAHQLATGGGRPGEGYPAVRQDMTVRRLTPTECERLQGFPDDWTASLSDSARYRTLGNAIAVPVAEYIGHQLLRRLAKSEVKS
jgi:DNA (cytosine-5)-methyltransferase 1